MSSISSSESSAFSSESDSSSSDESSDSETEAAETDKTPSAAEPGDLRRKRALEQFASALGDVEDGILPTCKTPEPVVSRLFPTRRQSYVFSRFQTYDEEDEVVPPKIPKLDLANARKRQREHDSDSSLSETELEYLEKRRRNTEWMEQIERERAEREERERIEVKVVEDDSINMDDSETRSATEDLNEDKSLEEMEADRESLLKAIRNPEPPVSFQLSFHISAISWRERREHILATS